MSEFASGVRGEAVVLGLGARGTLFALLRGGEDSRSSAEWIVLRAFNFPGGALPSPVEKGIADVRRLSGKVELPLKSLPMLVRFRDLNDPKSVEKVDPFNLATGFGGSTRLTGASIEIVPAGFWPFNSYGITGQPITTGIENRLKWLRALNGGYLDGAFAGGGPALSNILDSGEFQREI